MIKSRRVRWAGHIARKGANGNAYRISVRKLEGKKPLGKPRRKLEDNIVAYLLKGRTVKPEK
jgi:hypothetical protein